MKLPPIISRGTSTIDNILESTHLKMATTANYHLPTQIFKKAYEAFKFTNNNNMSNNRDYFH